MTHPAVSGKGADQEWYDLVSTLDLWLTMVDTHPWIQKCIIFSLSDQSVDTSLANLKNPICFLVTTNPDTIG
jgi:hypothetical protein